MGTPIEILCKVQTSPSDTSPVKFDWAYNSSSASPGLTPLRGGSLEGQAAATGLDDLENGIAVGRLSFMPQVKMRGIKTVFLRMFVDKVCPGALRFRGNRFAYLKE